MSANDVIATGIICFTIFACTFTISYFSYLYSKFVKALEKMHGERK